MTNSVATSAPAAVGAVMPSTSRSIPGPTDPKTPDTPKAATPAVAAGRKTARTSCGGTMPAKSRSKRRRGIVSGRRAWATSPAAISASSIT